jgi:uncharacterized protein YjbI with pentapeptide repeats
MVDSRVLAANVYFGILLENPMLRLNSAGTMAKTLLCRCLAVTIAIWIAIGGWTAADAIEYSKDALPRQDFSGQDLRDASFVKVNLRQSNFSGANLAGVTFFGANLEGSNFEGADLHGATLDSASMRRVNFKNANLEGAFATYVKFEGANIEGADFTGIIFRRDVQKYLCSIATGTNPTTKRNTVDTLECD